MENNWAAENLQTIRTIMERSALYRRALAPIMILAGTIGTLAGLAGYFLKLDSARSFPIYWMSVAVVAIVGALLLVRRQALKDAEPFWSSPTRRVTSALMPLLFIGLFFGVGAIVLFADDGAEERFILAIVWVLLYGCALHSAGFSMPRGIKLFGWGFIIGGCSLLAVFFSDVLPMINSVSPHLLMSFFFGVTHLAYGAYLYFTEPRKTEA